MCGFCQIDFIIFVYNKSIPQCLNANKVRASELVHELFVSLINQFPYKEPSTMFLF